MSSKRDRQGVRTPAQLEQKYSFGSDQKALQELRQLSAQYTRAISDMREQSVTMMVRLADMDARIAALTQEFILVGLTSTSGAFSLGETTYADLKALWDAGRCIVVYADQSDGTRRYYHCMGTTVENSVTGLLFQYGNGTSSETVFLGSNGSVTVGE